MYYFASNGSRASSQRRQIVPVLDSADAATEFARPCAQFTVKSLRSLQITFCFIYRGERHSCLAFKFTACHDCLPTMQSVPLGMGINEQTTLHKLPFSSRREHELNYLHGISTKRYSFPVVRTAVSPICSNVVNFTSNKTNVKVTRTLLCTNTLIKRYLHVNHTLY